MTTVPRRRFVVDVTAAREPWALPARRSLYVRPEVLMDRYTAIVAITSMIVGTAAFVTMVMAFVHLRTRRNPGVDMGAVGRIEDRLTRIEQGMDAVAVEVERISEAQRFTTKLLTEQQREKLRA